ncbi:MAG: C-GCAxxG-C-C family (seleno)protein [Fastidiosipilaceae bacterium]|jgi:C_GCAxxG_C_C family probable redox protein|nr:hypothetical protein [Clostridiaceae bacterium]
MLNKTVDYCNSYYEAGYNCAETALRAANDAWNLGLTEESFELMIGFGGGMVVGSVCGTITGGIAAIGRYFAMGEDRQYESAQDKVALFMDEVKSRYDSIDCVDLRPRFRTESDRCLRTVILVLEVLDEIMADVG